ncbi:MAG TPA: matrixin family metalloprotease [Gammaproteobacteria bacterium]|nr:matrixin family metalloprotease [Gammaproteobacteria bacterium]
MCAPIGLLRTRSLIPLLAATLASVGADAQTLAPLGPLEAGRVSYFIAAPLDEAAARPADEDLAVWAFESWERAVGGELKFERVSNEAEALVRLYWVPPGGGQYGEMRPLDVGGRRGAAVYIRPDTTALGPDISERARLDALFRDTVVYLTCVHELGHALGLRHTAEFEDIMYFFGFGGDIGEFFDRYRRRLEERGDIRAASALSPGDLAQLSALYARKPIPGQLTVLN